MKRFSEMNQTRIGLIGTVGVIALLLTMLSLGNVADALSGGGYSAAFAEAGGLKSGNTVRVSGITVGEVDSVELDGDHVRIEFTADDVRLGRDTTAAIKTESGLGTKFLALTPRGPGELDAEIPLAWTTSPYDITEAIPDLTKHTQRIDTGKLAQSFDTLSDTFADTPAHLRAALDGVQKLSKTVASRDGALRDVLSHAEGVTGVLADKNAEIVAILTDGNALLEAVQERRETIRRLLTGVQTLTKQLSGLVDDNHATLRPALTELRRSLKVLNAHADDLDKSVKLLSGFGRALMEAVGGGPFFYGYLVNIAPTSLAPMLPELFAGGEQRVAAKRGGR